MSKDNDFRFAESVSDESKNYARKIRQRLIDARYEAAYDHEGQVNDSE